MFDSETGRATEITTSEGDEGAAKRAALEAMDDAGLIRLWKQCGFKFRPHLNRENMIGRLSLRDVQI